MSCLPPFANSKRMGTLSCFGILGTKGGPPALERFITMAYMTPLALLVITFGAVPSPPFQRFTILRQSARLESKGSQASRLSCRISADITQLQRPPVFATVRIDNHSTEDFRSNVLLTFNLTPNKPGDRELVHELTYFADWDMRPKPKLPGKHREEIDVSKNSAVEVKVDLSKLYWSRYNFSTLPHLTLFKVVPKGSYVLYFEVHQADGSVACTSNEVSVLAK